MWRSQGYPTSLHDLPSPLDDLLRGDNRPGADRPDARQAVPPSRGVAHPIRPLFAKLLVAVAVAQQEQQAAIAEQVIALGSEFGRVDACPRFVHAGIVRRGAFPVALKDMEASPHDPREAIIRLLGRQSRENLVRADGFIPRPRPSCRRQTASVLLRRHSPSDPIASPEQGRKQVRNAPR